MSDPTTTTSQRVLIFNFFAGVMDRGIPLYAQDMATCMRRVGLEVVEMQCPRWLQRAPRVFLNFMFVLFEQFVAPVTGLVRGCAWTVYPYNSAGAIDALLGRSVLVVHDLIPNHRRSTKLSSLYIRTTQFIHRALSRPICAASSLTLSQLRRLPAFRRCQLTLWANPFYAFEAELERRSNKQTGPAPARLRVLLCSGMGLNKDYAGAVRLFRKSRLLADAELRIVGFGDDAELAMRRIQRLPDSLRSRIQVLPRLRLAQLVEEYTTADLVWVHSRKEGFGRCVAEALLSGRRVVASDIGAFRKLRGTGLHLYRNHRFDRSVELALSHPDAVGVSFSSYHARLEGAVRELLMQPRLADLDAAPQAAPCQLETFTPRDNNR